jgi:RimJ/RimL family protein N-acetyltransferase
MSLSWKPVPGPGRVILNGRCVTLEPLDADRHSADLWTAVRGHDEVWTWLADGPYVTEAELYRALLEKETSPGAVFFAVVPGASGRLPAAGLERGAAAGYASFMRIEPAHGVVEVGNILLAPSLQRTTAATEAMYLMASYVFDQLRYRRYEWKCNAENAPSRRAALRLGFSFEGIFRQHMVIKDRNRDTAWFAMLDCEWPARKRAFEAWLDPANFDADGVQRNRLEHNLDRPYPDVP